MLKDSSRDATLQNNKKYYIDNMIVMFDKSRNHKNDGNITPYVPYVHFNVGRIKSDGFTFNSNIIRSDNYRGINYSSSFDLIKVVKKEKFVDKHEDIYKNITTFDINNENEFPDLNDSSIYKHKTLTYVSGFASNTLRSIQRTVDEKFGRGTIVLEEEVFELTYNDKTYLYLKLESDKRFIVNKKNIEKLITYIKEESPYIIEMPKDYKKLDFQNYSSKNIDWLVEKYILQIGNLNK